MKDIIYISFVWDAQLRFRWLPQYKKDHLELDYFRKKLHYVQYHRAYWLWFKIVFLTAYLCKEK